MATSVPNAPITIKRDVTRPTLGNYVNIACFQYMRTGTENIVGRVPLIAAGRQRGYDLATTTGLAHSSVDPWVITEKLRAALGADGTHLCIVQQISIRPDGGYIVYITEGACTVGVTSEKPHCAFTLGVFVGAIMAMTGQRMIGRETACEAQGHDGCTYSIIPA